DAVFVEGAFAVKSAGTSSETDLLVPSYTAQDAVFVEGAFAVKSAGTSSKTDLLVPRQTLLQIGYVKRAVNPA
nr:hypothetical protein [Tanacetum cinerariifolium]